MTTRILTAKFAAEAALRAFDAKQLGFQDPERVKLGCLYNYPDGGVCGLGAALKEMKIKVPKNRNKNISVGVLRVHGLIDYSLNDSATLTNLQQAHDGIIRAKQDRKPFGVFKKKFIKLARRLAK
jgi:hypothetical protein